MTTLEIVLLCALAWVWGSYAFTTWEYENSQRKIGLPAVLIATTVPIIFTGLPILFAGYVIKRIESRRCK